jgi:hypothetical protein
VTTAQKAIGFVGVVMVLTAVLLPGRQTVPVLNATRNLATGVIHSAETGAA